MLWDSCGSVSCRMFDCVIWQVRDASWRTSRGCRSRCRVHSWKFSTEYIVIIAWRWIHYNSQERLISSSIKTAAKSLSCVAWELPCSSHSNGGNFYDGSRGTKKHQEDDTKDLFFLQHHLESIHYWFLMERGEIVYSRGFSRLLNPNGILFDKKLQPFVRHRYRLLSAIIHLATIPCDRDFLLNHVRA